MNDETASRRRRLIEAMLGMPVGGDLGASLSALRQAGVPVDDDEHLADLERRWESLQPAVDADTAGPEADAVMIVQPEFEETLDRVGSLSGPAALVGHSPAVRMLVSTRFVEGQIDNGGWVSVFVEGMGDWIPLAQEGWRLLGQPERTGLAAEAIALAAEPGPIDDPRWDRLDDSWRGLHDAESARATFIVAHPDAFRGSR